MKVGIAAAQGDSNFNSSYEFPPTEAVVYDVDLPPEVIRSLALIKTELSWGESVPIFNQTMQGHGNDYGLVFRVGEHDNVDLFPGDSIADFSRSGLIARVSMGMSNEVQDVPGGKLVLKDPTKLSRLHLNVYGARSFLPPGEERVADKEHFNYVSEEMHFSMRWVDGKFDNVWNDPAVWISEKDSRKYGKPAFRDMRTTNFETSDSTEYVNGHFYEGPQDRAPKAKTVIGLEDVERMIGVDRKRILPANVSLDEFMEIFPAGTSPEDAKKVSGYGERRVREETFRHVGYGSALNVLSEYGDVSPDDLVKLTGMRMGEGVEYIFGKVLPAMKNFSKA